MGASPQIEQQCLVYVLRRLPLYVCYEVVYPTGWPFYFLIVEDLRQQLSLRIALGVAITAVLRCCFEYFTPSDLECVLHSLEPLLLLF